MTVQIQFFSWFRELAGCAATSETVPDGATLGELQRKLALRFPRFAAVEKSTLLAVGTEYQPRNYVLKEGDLVSLFPPVQGG